MWFPHRAFQCLMITSVEILSHDARLLLVSWTETDNMFFLCTVAPTGWNTSLQKSRNSCTPKFQHRTVPTRFPQQFQCGFSWPPSSPDLYPSDYPPPPPRLSQGQKCSLKSDWAEGMGHGQLCTGHKSNARPYCTELCITSPRAWRSYRECYPQSYPYVKL